MKNLFLLITFVFLCYSHSIADEAITSEECTNQSGRIVNTLNEKQCQENETEIGKVSGMRCPCVCCAKKNPFKVGLVLPLTGVAADYGVAIKNNIDLAIKDRPELFTNIHFQYEDAAFDPRTAVTSLNKLINSDHVNLTVTWGVAFCKALAPIAESKKKPLVGICLDPGIATNKRYVLRFKNTTDEIMRAQADYLLNRGVKNIGLLVAEHPYLEEVTLALERNLLPGQTVTIIDRIPNTEMDLRTHIVKLKQNSKKFDSIGVFLFAGQIATFYRQAHDLKFTTPTFGTDFFESLSEIEASKGTMEGATFTSIDIKEPFLKRYKETFHNESQLAFGAPAYEFAITVGELFNDKGGELTAEEIIKNFSTVTFREGVASGPYKYVNDAKAGQYFQFPVVVKEIQKNGFKILD
jgi:ABC-type branched-subunit amino acid transport system substrate-binding protein